MVVGGGSRGSWRGEGREEGGRERGRDGQPSVGGLQMSLLVRVGSSATRRSLEKRAVCKLAHAHIELHTAHKRWWPRRTSTK